MNAKDTSHTALLAHPTLLPPLLLLVLTTLLLVAAYSARPHVALPVGDYYDSAYLHGFHAREVDAAGGGQTWDWPDAAPELTVPGGLSGDWMATVQADTALPGRPLSGVALDVNGTPVRIPRDSSHQFTAFVPAELAAQTPLVLRLRPALTDGPTPDARVVQQITLEPARTYRWTRAASTIALPDLGRGTWQVALRVVATHPDGVSPAARLAVNDTPLLALPDSSEVRIARVLVPNALMPDGDMRLTLSARTFADPRPLGVLLAGVHVTPLASPASVLPWLPPWDVLQGGLLAALAAYACLALALVGMVGPVASSGLPRLSPGRARWLAMLGTLVLAAAGAWALHTWRFPGSLMLPGVAGLALWSLLLLLALRWLLLRLFPSRAFVHALLLVFVLGYWARAGGVLFPFFIGIDVSWHMDRVRQIFAGDLPLFYGPNSPLNEATMPVAEWGENPPVIPYSPWFHMAATSFGLLPWRLEFTANMANALLDSSKIVLVGLLAHRGGLSLRTALLAAMLYAALPVTFLLLSWGNMPTTFGLWWALAATTWAVARWRRLHEWGSFWGLVALLLASFLAYTVTGVFVGLFLFLFTGALWLAARRGGLALLGGLRPFWGAALGAMALALLVYYGQYVGPIIERTLPYFLRAGEEAPGLARDTFDAYLLRHARLVDYGLVLPLVAGLAYLLWGWWARFRLGRDATQTALLWAALAAWVAILLLFVPVGFRVSMVDKHFFAAVPLLCVATAALAEHLGKRLNWAGWVLVALYYGATVGTALALWLHRIALVRQG